jgi:hypothetical protein
MGASVYERTGIIRANPNLLLSVNHHKDWLKLNLLLGEVSIASCSYHILKKN